MMFKLFIGIDHMIHILIQRDKDLKLYLEENNIEVKTFNSLLLWEPWQVAKPDGSPYRVFSPFYRKGC